MRKITFGKTMKVQNPFLLAKYISPKYFCNRTIETEKIVGAVTNNRNFAIYSQKGLGKTTLIHNVFYELKELDNFQTVYLDLSSINNMFDFVNVFVNSLIEKEIVTVTNKKKTKIILDAIIIEKQIDLLSDRKSFEIKIENEKEVLDVLEQIFDYLNIQNKTIVVAFDEFQKIVDCPEKVSSSLLIKLIDNSENTSFIFSGSNQTKLLSALNYKNQSINSVEILQIEPLAKEKYQKFISKKFLKKGIKISDKNIEFILEWSRLNTFCIHKICNIIYEKKTKKVKISLVKKVINNVLIEKSTHYLNYKNLLSHYQWKLLKSIATEGEAKSITSNLFITKYKLNAPSSVKTAITALIDKELVIKEIKTYKICDVFFERWLKSTK